MHRRTYDPVLVLKIIPPYLSCVHKFSRIFLVPKRCSVIFILQKLSVSRQVFKLILIHLNSFSRLKLNLMRKYAKKLHIHALIQVFKPNSFSLWEKVKKVMQTGKYFCQLWPKNIYQSASGGNNSILLLQDSILWMYEYVGGSG